MCRFFMYALFALVEETKKRREGEAETTTVSLWPVVCMMSSLSSGVDELAS